MSVVQSIRCSSLDKLWACTPAVLGSGIDHIRISPTNDAAALGKTVHTLAEDWVAKGDYSLEQACDAEGFNAAQRDDVAKLMGYVTRSWEELSKYFPAPEVERRVESSEIKSDDGGLYKIVGTCDILSAIGTNNAIFLDWKSGFLDDGYHQQMAGYAYSIWCALGRPPNTIITGVAVFLRHRYYRVTKWDATKLCQWEYDLTHNVLPARDRYAPGKQCTRCDMYATCPARQAVVTGMINAVMPRGSRQGNTEYDQFLDEARGLLASLTEENKGSPTVGEVIEKLSHRIRMAQQQIDEAKNLIRTSVQRVGAIKMPGDYYLTMRDVEVNKVKPVRAMKVLRQHMPDTDICQAMRISLPTVLNSYGRRFKQGDRTAAREQLLDALRKADAIQVDVQHRLEEIDASKAEMMAKETHDGDTTGNHSNYRPDDQGEGSRS